MNVNLQKIEGCWDKGYVLDYHIKSSEYIGVDNMGHKKYENIRTEVGEAMYKLKYKDDKKQLDRLADVFSTEFTEKFKDVELLIPMPPSKCRGFQPLEALVEIISVKMNLPVFSNILLKTSRTPQMKDIDSYEEKMKVLRDSIKINDGIDGTDSWNILIVDDLYGTGASLNVAAEILRGYSKINSIYVGVFTKTK